MIDGYPDDDERERELEDLARRAGGALVDVGTSIEGRPIRAARVAASHGSAKRVLVNANIHGPEWIGSRVALGLLRALAEDREEVRALRAATEIVVLPCINVDGYARTVRQRGAGTLKELRCNAHG